MDLNYDYGDVVHTHGHIHTKPDSHKQVVEHALKEWCHSLFGEESEEKCEELNEIEFHDIDDGSRNELKVSDIFKAVNNLKKLSGHYVDLEEKNYKIIFKGTQIIFSELNNDPIEPKEIKIVKEDTGFKLKTDNLEITENGLKKLEENNSVKILTKFNLNSDDEEEFFNLDYDGSVVNELKQTLRNLDLNKLKERIELINKDIKSKDKEIKRHNNIKVDEVSSKRKLDNMELLEKDKIKEIILLVILLIIGVCFGIFCVYTGFVLELD
jgi:hypothetical protein